MCWVILLSHILNKPKLKTDFNVLYLFPIVLASTILTSTAFEPFWNVHYHLAHSLVEGICIYLAFTGFIIALTLFSHVPNEIQLLGVGFLSAAVFDLAHILSSVGVITSSLASFDLAGRYWVAGRLVEAIVLFLTTRGVSFRYNPWFCFTITLTVMLLVSFAFWRFPNLLPPLYQVGVGATLTKAFIEYIIVAIFSLSLLHIYRTYSGECFFNKRHVVLAILIAIPAELIFAVFPSTTSFQSAWGHLLKICYYYYLFKGIFVNTIIYPYQQMEQSFERFMISFHSSPVMKVIISLNDYSYIDVNQAYLNNTGFTRDDIIGKSQREVSSLSLDTHQFIANGPVSNLQIKYNTKEGNVREAILNTEVIILNSNRFLYYEFIDITEKNRYERELTRLDRLNIVGQMAAGIGHEVRNPLTTVRGFLQIFSKNEELKKYEDYLHLMISELDRANAIITEFLSLTRTKSVHQSEHSLNDIINHLMPLLQAKAWKEDKSITPDLHPIPKILLNEDEIRQLLLNLINNGLDASEAKGAVTISTYGEDEAIILAIKDEGAGIPKEAQDKIGLPFYTTKASGTGLGLATCFKIAERHNAKIDFVTGSEGTTFFVKFQPVRYEIENTTNSLSISA
ncbi:PAS domain S-box protein [Heliobacillus mobilis]|uniref:histidine kinase n=1 Tax=Heliobacterium mobile TaxID=28064 RepID=A0A6I3SI36_HELMO|nr:MASE3 domain-containing protein [Heliobacterium mobile]MTV48534.1 PAS domain S-box protein [Heliobacterium mobile]